MQDWARAYEQEKTAEKRFRKDNIQNVDFSKIKTHAEFLKAFGAK